MKLEIRSLQETIDFANKLAELINGSFLLTLEGDLGAGKTTFTKALGKALGISQTINSPTFTILKQYPKLNHIDAYRLENLNQELGFEEIFEEDKLCVVEWAQFIEDFLPKERLSIYIHFIEDEKRIFEIKAVGNKYEKVLEELK